MGSMNFCKLIYAKRSPPLENPSFAGGALSSFLLISKAVLPLEIAPLAYTGAWLFIPSILVGCCAGPTITDARKVLFGNLLVALIGFIGASLAVFVAAFATYWQQSEGDDNRFREWLSERERSEFSHNENVGCGAFTMTSLQVVLFVVAVFVLRQAESLWTPLLYGVLSAIAVILFRYRLRN